MADQLLSIEDSSLTAIANAIRSKGGTNAALSFPNGFVSALQAIETEATVTPKITAEQKTLTPNDTSFAISPGFHDGTGTVSIQTETGSANPTSTQQTYTPSAGKFFSSFSVGGIGSGMQVITGETTAPNSNTVSVSGFGFTPVGMIVITQPPNNSAASATSTSPLDLITMIVPNASPSTPGWYTSSYDFVQQSTVTNDFRYGSASITGFANGTFKYPCKYVIWGS